MVLLSGQGLSSSGDSSFSGLDRASQLLEIALARDRLAGPQNVRQVLETTPVWETLEGGLSAVLHAIHRATGLTLVKEEEWLSSGGPCTDPLWISYPALGRPAIEVLKDVLMRFGAGYRITDEGVILVR